MPIRPWSRKYSKKMISGEVPTTATNWAFITVGQVLEELAKEGLYMSRNTFYQLEKSGLFKLRRSVGGWRTMTRREADAVKRLCWINYTGLTHEEFEKRGESFGEERE